MNKVFELSGGDDHKAVTSRLLDHQNFSMHIKTCTIGSSCSYPRCSSAQAFIKHYRNCNIVDCRVCFRVRNMQQKRKESTPHISPVNEIYDTRDNSGSQSVVATKDLNPVQKRLKIDHVLQSVPSGNESWFQSYAYSDSRALQQGCTKISDVTCTEMENRASLAKGSLSSDNSLIGMSNDGSSMLITTEKGIDDAKFVCVTEPVESLGAEKLKKPEADGASLIELFTPDEVREHILSLKQGVGQSKLKTGKPQAMEQLMSECPCQLCGMTKINFEPIPIHCTPCGARVKRNAKYYTAEAVDSKQHICNLCYNKTPGDSIVVNGTPCPKARLEKQKNDKFIEEGWVECDRCHAWQHQICALFNCRRNKGGQAYFTCPFCYIAQVERGEFTPLQQGAVLGAKDLPRTSLSDHLEERLVKKLKQERVNRARVQGKTYDEVPGAEFLVVRVVSSLDKKLEVKKRFFEAFKEVNYPNEFAYKSKFILLFQKIEGVEVCLFSMIVQEFGANCQEPNNRRVYLSYMDSVKYFRPEIKAVTGEDLRTFVYHEILIGYLEHCKKRGFTSCYIWACPPIKGDDYIFYCHPETQKTPKSDKLREWYITMLEKAAKENIVVEVTNLYDHFFVSGGSSGDCKVNVTAARLPYFDGDYFPGAIDDFIYQLQKEEGGIVLAEKPTTKLIAKSAIQEYDQADLSRIASKDVLLMHKLQEAISPKKEDFIMVHLQHSCSHCCTLMTSGNVWGCCKCKNFSLCDKCYKEEQKLEKKDRHPVNNHREIHILYPVEVSGIPEDTQVNDEILNSKFFDTRLTLLELCEGNHYQFDTLRRAKYSSMMLLYHLHNPYIPAFMPVCHVCRINMETGQGWHCETCPDFNLCSTCYQKDGNHSHTLTQDPSIMDVDAQNEEVTQQKVVIDVDAQNEEATQQKVVIDVDAQNEEATQQKVVIDVDAQNEEATQKVARLLDLLVHALQCQNCQNPNCCKMKSLIQHGAKCKTRETGCCVQCKKICYLFKHHAESCKLSQCHIPHCRGLKEQIRRNKEQAELRGQAAKTERTIQQASEVSG